MEYHDKQPDYKQLQKYVDGSIQIVPYFSKLTVDGIDYKRGTAFCNENGHMERRQFNERASAFWRKACPKGEPSRMEIVGSVVFTCLEPKQNVAKSERLSVK